MPDDQTVRLYDSNNRLLGEMALGSAKERAAEQGLDVILKTMSTTPPVVQLAPYRADLIKAFFQKYTQLKTSGNIPYLFDGEKWRRQNKNQQMIRWKSQILQ